VKRLLIGSPRPDVGVREWDWRGLIVYLAVLLAVFGLAVAVVPDGVLWRMAAFVVGVVAAHLAERRFRGWKGERLRAWARRGHGGSPD
jgi:hypothetical protein